MNNIIAATTFTVFLSGCASVINDTTHPMKIETMTSAGTLINGAECTVTNDKATQVVKSGETANVRRSNQDLDITCRHPSNPDAVAKATSRANAGLFGNLIIGGGIGALVDHSRGTAYTYPTWVRLIFGRILTFDRRNEVDGTPVGGMESDEATKATPSEAQRGPDIRRAQDNPRRTNEELQRW